MRFRLVPSVLVTLALLALPAVAAAGPQPIKKPDTPAKKVTPPASKNTAPPANTNTNTSSNSNTGSSQTPIKKPDTGTTSGTGSTAKTPTGTSTGKGTTLPPKVVVVDVVGRDQSSAEITLPPVVKKATPVAPDPTPLGIVAVSERIRAHSGTPTPAWKLALLALLAAAEAFLVVRLVRHRPGGGLSPAS